MIFWLLSFFQFADKSTLVVWNTSTILWCLSLQKVEIVLFKGLGKSDCVASETHLRHHSFLCVFFPLVHSLWGMPAAKREGSHLALWRGSRGLRTYFSCEQTNLEAEPSAQRCSHGCSPGWHPDSNCMGHPEPEPPRWAPYKFWTHRNCVRRWRLF